MKPIAHIPLKGGAVTAERETLQNPRAAERGVVREAHKSSGIAGALEQVEAKAMMLWPLEMASALFLPVSWVVGKVGGVSAKAWTAGTVSSAITGLKNTGLGDVGKLRANTAEAFEAIATGAEAHDLAKAAGRAKVRWAANDSKVVASVTKGIAGAFSAAESRMTAAAGAQGSGMIDGMVRKAANWNVSRLEGAAVKGAEQLVANKAQVGFFRQGMAMVGLQNPMEVTAKASIAQPVHRAANDVARAVKGGKYDAAALARHAKGSASGITEKALSGLKDSTKGQAQHAAEQAVRLGSTLEKVSAWKAVESKGMKALVPHLFASAKRIPIFTAIIGTGLVAGSAALLIRAKESNRDASDALKELASDLSGVPLDKVNQLQISGPNAAPLLKHVQSQLGKQKAMEWLSAGLHTGANGVLLSTLSSAGMAGMFVQMGMDSVAGALKSENPFLSAYSAFKQHEAGQIKLAPEELEKLTMVMISHVPVMAEHGGLTNKMAEPLAKSMLAEGMNSKQIVQELNTPKALELRVAKLHEAAKVEVKAPAEPAKPTLQVQAANENKPFKVASIQHEGRVADAAVSRAH